MPRGIVATRSARRRIPSSGNWDLEHWNWEPVVAARRRSRRAAWWMLFAGVAILALVVVQVGGRPAATPPMDEDVLWMEESPPATIPPTRTESVQALPDAPSLQETPVMAPAPLEVVPPSPVASSNPTFGTDDAVSTGDLAVASGTTLAQPAMEPDRPRDAAAGPLVLGSVPASTKAVVPRYPPSAEASGLEANVLALVTTDTAGNVVDFRIERSGGREFDESVRRAALSTRFKVPVKEGRPRAVAFRLPYSFRLE